MEEQDQPADTVTSVKLAEQILADGSDSSEEITDISQLNTDFLGDDAKAKFEKAKTFCSGRVQR